MKRPELYHKTVGILVDAYFNDTLAHGNCHACAVGNMIAANKGYEVTPSKILNKNDSHRFGWDNYNAYEFLPGYYNSPLYPSWFTELSSDKKSSIAESQIRATGYTSAELQLIELSFERATRGDTDDEWMFNGLMAVIDVLDKIHENNDTEITTHSKQRFQKA